MDYTVAVLDENGSILTGPIAERVFDCKLDLINCGETIEDAQSIEDADTEVLY